MVESRNFLGETPDERRNRRKDAMIDATLSLVHDGGLPAIGVRSVTAHAKLSSRYFYESFTDTDDLLIATLHRVSHQLIETGMTGLHTKQLPHPTTATESKTLDRFRSGLDAAIRVVDDDPRKAALIAAVAAGGPRLRQELQQLVLIVATAITSDVNAAAIGFDSASALFVAGGTVQLTLAYISGELDIVRDELVDQLARLTLGALRTPIDRDD